MLRDRLKHAIAMLRTDRSAGGGGSSALYDLPWYLVIGMSAAGKTSLLTRSGLSAFKAMLVAIGSGLMEPLGSLVGLGISSGFAIAYPLSMGLAAGAMIFVVSHEVIPETHR
ncbi:hypothetical protein PSYPI_40839, partial [Pseudomonas syringae pv. pisi str. 1704B]